VRLERRLGARDDALDPLALAPVDTRGEELRIDPEPVREPADRLVRGPELIALDLAHVLLREARLGELGLGEPSRDSSLAQTLAEGRRDLACGDRFLACHCRVKNRSL
jgi:hypothetical protein